MQSVLDLLWPKPQRIRPGEETLVLDRPLTIRLEGDASLIYPQALRLASVFRLAGLDARITAAPAQRPGVRVELRLAPGVISRAQGYLLSIGTSGIELAASDLAGLAYGVSTLVQLLGVEQTAPLALPCVLIEDWPDFAHRGVMLDVSRDRVPTLDTMYALVDLLASFKINQLQLYMEHTFAYEGHEVVWQHASPFTGEEILALDAYCRERFVELVPNQNSFGHMHRWLIHEPYRQLAECPDGVELWPGHTGEPFSLCPGDPRALALLADLYDQLLPHFSSGQLNVGCDETFDLGRCRSAAVCAEKGTERVYLEFLRKVHDMVSARGRQMQFWGDIILHRPELIPELPPDAIALEWGYEATHPFAEHAALFAQAGLSFYVCPGTSSWNTIAGRTDNALLNIQNAAHHGYAAGAVGLLNTDWGDNGHLQPLSVSYLGYLAGAGASWNSHCELLGSDIAKVLDAHVFRDRVGVMGGVAYDLGNVYQLCGVWPANASALFLLLLHPEQPLADGRLTGLSIEGLQATLDEISGLLSCLEGADLRCGDGEWVIDEYRWAAAILYWAADLALTRCTAGASASLGDLPLAVRQAFSERLSSLIEQHRWLWLRRSRPGGLSDSVSRLQRVQDLLIAD